MAFDRSTYATALKVWLPLAEQGDAVAQTYVGEIFEKGLGLPPDYGAAAQWYRRAAEKGYSRAAVNLGNLYEQGLGVPKQPAEAMQWYRRAAGPGRSRLQGGLRGRRLDDAGVFQGVLDARCMGPRDANWR